MSHQRPRSRPSAASRLTNREVGRGTGFPHATAAILGFLLLATVFLGACNQEGREEPTPEPVPTNTAAPLPATAAPTALPPAATFTATAAATETASPQSAPTAEATATLTATVTAATAVAPSASLAVVTVLGDMNVRRGPGTDQERIGGATAGQEFAITGKNQEGDWWQIDFDGQTGWIYAPYVTAANEENVPLVGSSLTQTPAPAADTPTPEEPAVIVIGEMNIRNGAGTEYDIIGSATAGREFAITGKNQEGDWWQIDFEGKTGWIYAPFVVASGTENVPVVAAAPTPTADSIPPTATTEPEAAAPLATANGLINVRSGPGTVYLVLGEALTGQQFAILGKSQDEEWWQIDFEGQTGWIYAPIVTVTNAENVQVATVIPAPPPAENTSPPITPAEPGTAGPELRVIGLINVRSGPGTNYAVIGRATPGEYFAVSGINLEEDWWQIDYDGQTGWVFAQFVTATDGENVPVVTDIPTPPPAEE